MQKTQKIKNCYFQSIYHSKSGSTLKLVFPIAHNIPQPIRIHKFYPSSSEPRENSTRLNQTTPASKTMWQANLAFRVLGRVYMGAALLGNTMLANVLTGFLKDSSTAYHGRSYWRAAEDTSSQPADVYWQQIVELCSGACLLLALIFVFAKFLVWQQQQQQTKKEPIK